MIATFTPRDPSFEVGVRRSFSRLALMSTIAARLTRIVPGEVEIDMPVRDDLTQQHGFVAAGIVTAIIDTACGYAAMSLMPAGHTVVTVCRALRRGGRFVGEFGGHGCIAAIMAAIYAALARRGLDGRALNPWHFPGADDYAGRLSAHGLRVDFVALVRRPTILPGDFSGFMETFGDAFTKAVEASERQAFVDEIRESLRPTLFDPARGWIADYVVLRFAASKS